MTITSVGGDLLDALLDAHYGRADDAILRAVLAANPGLAVHGPVLPKGIVITLPALQQRPTPALRLWD